MHDIDAVLKDRRTTHGDFADTAVSSQKLKGILYNGITWADMPMELREAAEMIVHKLARATNGNPYEVDHWRDIEGYARLAAKAILQKPTMEGICEKINK